MPVDDMSFLLGQAEFPEDPPSRIFLLQQAVIRILLFPVGLLVCQEIPLKGSHLVLSKQRRVLMEPDIPADIPALLSFLAVNGHKGLAHIAVKALIKRLSFAFSPIYFHLFKAAVLI